MWACPGGRAEPEETPEQAVAREVEEEVGLKFNATRLFAIGKYENRYLYRFLGNWFGNVKIQEEEVAELGWFSYEEAIKLKLSFDYKEIIEKLRNENII